MTAQAKMARQLTVGEWFLYRNQYDQVFNAKLTAKHITEDNRVFLMVKREEWPRDECLAVSDFENGTYSVVD